MSWKIENAELPMPYHKGNNTRVDRLRINNADRRFIAWDGEGMFLKDSDKPQDYVLFGCSTGECIKGRGLRLFDLLDFIIEVGQRNPGAWHVGFAFNYDANMIVRHMSERSLKYLYLNGYVHVGKKPGYCISWRPSKSFTVTRYGPNYNRESNANDKSTVRIYDLFGFFQCSFVKSVRDLLGDGVSLAMEIVKEGKAARNEFSYDKMDYVERYWRAEIELLERLADELRSRLYAVDLHITQWHGPGAVASYANRVHNVKPHMSVCRSEVREAARYAYAGGRFELFKAGRIVGPIYQVDINSAYPYGISQLPSLSEGEWNHVDYPDTVARFGVYRIRVAHPLASRFARAAGPLFHRDERHNISYPWYTEGWYWSPELVGLLNSPHVELIEGWEYRNASSLPFSWVPEMYAERKRRKAMGDGSQLALKLCLNSLYGKMAQRVGYDEKRARIPPWHQLEWAGWVTSYTRAMLYGAIRKIGIRDLIAVETDGIYTTRDPRSLGLTIGSDLGEWEYTEYDEIMYVQSGLSYTRQGDVWSEKYRGLDKGTFPARDAAEYLRSLKANTPWNAHLGSTTRFVGLGAALQRDAPLKTQHCRWETKGREVMPGEKGKRMHIAAACDACRNGANAYEQAHDMVIRSHSRAGVMSEPHYIPWEGKDNGDTAEWREYAESV